MHKRTHANTHVRSLAHTHTHTHIHTHTHTHILTHAHMCVRRYSQQFSGRHFMFRLFFAKVRKGNCEGFSNEKTNNLGILHLVQKFETNHELVFWC